MLNRGHVQAFASTKEKYGLTESLDLGLRTVQVDNIVGSVNRWRDFDARFRIKNRATMHRYMQIKLAVERGKIMPPVYLYKVRDKYYVVDGNHRVSAAKEVGQTYIDAHVVEFFPPPDSEVNLIWRERSAFEHKTGLTNIHFTELGSYDKLLLQIEDFRTEESEALGTELSLENASASWEQEIYKPVCQLIHEQGLLKEFPGRTEADLFLYASYHRLAKSRLTKEKVSYREALNDFKAQLPEKSLAEQLRDLITGLFNPDDPDQCPQGLIFDEDGLVRVTPSCRGCGRCIEGDKIRKFLPPQEQFPDY